VGVEPNDVGASHVRGGQDGLQVAEGVLELSRHVARMLRVTVGVDYVLAAANEQPLVPSTSSAWSPSYGSGISG
jgi:hypothetical protein